jgi:hypothetical protein
LADPYLQKNLSPSAYATYKLAASYVYALSDQLSGRLVQWGESLAGTSTTSPSDQANFDASVQSDSGELLASQLNTADATVPTSTTSPGDFTTLSNELDALVSLLQTLTATPQAASQYSAALNAFSTCGTPFFNDLASLGEAVASSGGTVTQAQLDQAQSDVQGVINCGAALYASLNQAATAASATVSGTENGSQVEVTAAKCDGQGCWITEETTASNGQKSTETGYRSCYSDGFCPLFLH